MSNKNIHRKINFHRYFSLVNLISLDYQNNIKRQQKFQKGVCQITRISLPLSFHNWKNIDPNPSSSHWAVPWYESNTIRLNRNEARLNSFLSPLFYNCIIYTHFLLLYKAMKSSFFFKSGLWLLCGHWIEKQFNSLNSVFVASMYVSYPSLRLTACLLIQDLPHQMSSLILQVFRWILSWYTGCLLNRYQAAPIWTLEQGMDLQSKKFVKLYHHNILFASCTNSLVNE